MEGGWGEGGGAGGQESRRARGAGTEVWGGLDVTFMNTWSVIMAG